MHLREKTDSPTCLQKLSVCSVLTHLKGFLNFYWASRIYELFLILVFIITIQYSP